MSEDNEAKVVWGIWPWSGYVTKSSTGTPQKRNQEEIDRRKAEYVEREGKSGPVITKKAEKPKFKKGQIVEDNEFHLRYEVLKVIRLTKELQVQDVITKRVFRAPQEDVTIVEGLSPR
jgi:hypothetical protein